MKNMKFATKLLLVVLSISLASMIIVAVIAYSELLNLSGYSQDVNTQLGFMASGQSQDALIKQAESYLSRLSAAQAGSCDESLIKIQDNVIELTRYMERLYAHPDNFKGRELPLPNETEMDIASSKMMIAKGVSPSPALDAEKLLISNAEYMFGSVFATNQMLNNAYLGTESGISYRFSKSNAYNPDFDPRQRPWYQAASAANGPIWLDTYVDSYGAIGTTCAMAFKAPSGVRMGVVGGDILLSTMVDDILKVRIGETGYAFLLDDAGNYLAHPRYNEIDPAALASAQGDYKTVLEAMANGESGVRAANVDGVDCYVAFAPLETTGWSLGIIVETNEVIEGALTMKSEIDQEALTVKDQIRAVLNSVLFRFLILLCISIVVVMVLSFLVAGSITKPITRLTKSVELVGQGHLDQKIDIESGDEIGKLATTFNSMTDNLQSYIQNLARVTADKERIGAELGVAHQIQTSLLPCTFPAYPNRAEFDIVASMEAARQVGGDFYDFFLIDDNTLAVVIADVSGKGIPAALFMVISRTLIKNSVQSGLAPTQVFEHVNNLLCENNGAGMFVTALLGYLDINTGDFRYVNAGHNPPMIYRAGGKYERLPTKAGFVLAGMEDMRYREQNAVLNHGDVLYLYTDGVTEATNLQDDLFGEDYLIETMNRYNPTDIHALLPAIKKEIDLFADGAEQADDITMLAVLRR